MVHFACYSYLQILKIGFNHFEVLVWVSLLCITYCYIAPKLQVYIFITAMLEDAMIKSVSVV